MTDRTLLTSARRSTQSTTSSGCFFQGDDMASLVFPSPRCWSRLFLVKYYSYSVGSDCAKLKFARITLRKRMQFEGGGVRKKVCEVERRVT